MIPAMIPALALVAAASLAAGPLAVDPAKSVVKFHLHHKMHAVDGRSASIEGKAVLGADGKVMAMVRIPVSSFDTGDANRDSHMRDTLEAARFPFVVFKGVTSFTAAAAGSKAVDLKIQGELEFHGVKQPIEVPVQVTFGGDGGALVTSKFAVSLEAHKIERPSLLLLKVDDQLLMDVELKLVNAPK